MGFRQRGLDLTGSGVRYLYPQSAQPLDRSDVVGSMCAFHVARCKTQIGSDAASVAEIGTSTRRPAGSGFTGIGEFYEDTRDVRRERNRGFDEEENRRRTLEPHLRAIERSNASEFVKACARAYLMTRFNQQNLEAFIEHDLLLPMNFIIFQPHKQYRTLGMVFCRMGCGRSAIGNSDLIQSHDGMRKIAKWHYTIHRRTIITEPKNVYVVPDVYSEASERGSNCRFFTPETYAQLDLETFENSLICVAIPITETNFPNPMDIRGRHYTNYGAPGARGTHDRLHYSTAARYVNLYNLMQAHQNGVDEPSMAHIVVRTHRGHVTYQGHQQGYNPISGEYSRVVNNTGHWGPNIWGSSDTRDGALEFLPEAYQQPPMSVY